MKYDNRLALVLLVMLCSGVCAFADNWALHSFSGGWCYIQSVYQIEEGVHYLFDHQYGDLTLMADDSWTVIYRSQSYGGQPVDIPTVDTSVLSGAGSFSLTLSGRNLTGYLWLPNVTVSGDKVLRLHLRKDSTGNGGGPHTGDIVTRQSGAGAIDIGGVDRVVRPDIPAGGVSALTPRRTGHTESGTMRTAAMGSSQ